MSAELLRLLSDAQAIQARMAVTLSEIQRMLVVGVSDESDGECRHPVDQRVSVSGMSSPAFHCRACGAIVEVHCGEDSTS